MAKQTKKLKSFEEVNSTLLEIGMAQTKVESLTADMNEEILRVKEAFEKEVKPLQEKIKTKEKLISAFCRSNKSEFKTKRTLKLTFGKVGYRTGKMALGLINKKWTWDRAAEAFSKMFSLKYVKIETVLKKDEVIDAYSEGKLDADTLTACGVKIKQAERFHYSINYNKIKADAD